MAGTIVDFLVGKLKEPAFDEIKFQWGIKNEIEKSTDRLAHLKGYVEDFCKGKQDTNTAKILAKELRETSIDLDDVVDEFLLEMKLLELKTTPPCNFCELNSLISTVLSFPKKTYLQYCFHKQLKAIDERLLFLEEEKSKYKIELKTRNEARNELLMGSGSGYMDAVEAVGINMEFERIAELIEKRSEDQMKAITIWGAGGSGKTTLAKQVYEKVKGDGSIDCFSWVDVNHSSDIEYVLRETIKSLCKSVETSPPLGVEKADRNSLLQDIDAHLKGKRYVLFFDDVWDHNLLSQINIQISRASSIIVTSRHKDIGDRSFLGARRHHIEVKPLAFDLASNLFCKLAFPYNNDGGWPSDTIKEYGVKLVEKCSGLPLAILAMAGLMSTKGSDDLREWRDALKSLESELDEGGSLAGVNRVVLLSYNELPTHLKSCFLYCAMFPKTYGVDVETLVRMCIAEGFINEEEEEEGHIYGGRTVEEIVRGYFIQLRNRSLLQFGEELGRIELHDLYRDVGCEVIRKEMFGEIILEHNNTIPAEWKKQRRLFIFDDKVRIENYQNMKRLRTLLMSEQSSSFPQMLKSIKLLRVLELGEMPDDMEEVPNEVGDLIHLRYFRLSSNSISCLTDSLGRLHNLQTLDIRLTNVKSLPNSVSELKQLRHLFGRNLEVPDSVFTFSHLQTLSGIRITTINQATELSNITQLTELMICFEGEESWWRAICVSVQKMTNLRSLYIRLICSDDRAWEFGNFSPPLHLENLHVVGFGKLVKFTTTTLNCLRSLSIVFCEVDEDLFSSLEKLPNLLFLGIRSYSGEKLLFSDGSFPKLNKLLIVCKNLKTWEIGKGAMKCLQSLRMYECTSLKTWEIGKGAMKCLHFLHMYGCTSLQMLPQGLTQLQSLKLFYLHDPSQLLVERISVGGSDRWKVKHIPRVFML